LDLTTSDPRCGTPAGYKAHYRRKDKPCAECKKAHSERNSSWAKDHPDAIKEYKTKWLTENAEAIRIQRKEYCERTIESKRETTRQHYKNNKDLYIAAGRRRRARVRSNPVEVYSTQQVLDTYGTACHLCSEEIDLQANRKAGEEGWERGLHIDHVIPIALGGSDTLDNVKPSHAQCNLSKGMRLNNS
jgi:5-methylcytosine-specific restriction endonuclease McrA